MWQLQSSNYTDIHHIANNVRESGSTNMIENKLVEPTNLQLEA